MVSNADSRAGSPGGYGLEAKGDAQWLRKCRSDKFRGKKFSFGYVVTPEGHPDLGGNWKWNLELDRWVVLEVGMQGNRVRGGED